MSKKSVSDNTQSNASTPNETILPPSAFRDPAKDKYMNAVEYALYHMTWEQVLSGDKAVTFDPDPIFSLSGGTTSPPTSITDTHITLPDGVLSKLPHSKPLSKFTVLCLLRHKGNTRACISDIEFKYLKGEIPYIRVGTDYFKVVLKPDRYNISRKNLKSWKKETITQDHGHSILTSIPIFDDFCISPNNRNYAPVVDGYYNLYSQFSHKAHPEPVTPDRIPASLDLMQHIFGDQLDIGLQYMKILYELPRQALPVLALVSNERETGKTTFINWINMIFGDNYILIHPEDISKDFNSQYANKNIISIDETVIDKTSTVEKLKSLATAKTISVNQKYVANYMLPFFAKIIVCTNKERDFMRIDDEEIRFWVRKIDSIKKKDAQIEDKLSQEIPFFLRYLLDCVEMPDRTRSRMVFTVDQIANQYLDQVKEESRSTLYKELSIAFTNLFNEWTTYTEFHCTPTDIKKKFFASEHNISASYIHKVLRDEFKLTPNANSRYRPFNADMPGSVVGKYFIIPRDLFLKDDELFTDEPPF